MAVSPPNNSHDIPPADEARLWRELRSGDAGAREQLILHHMPFARTLAAKLYAGRIDHDLNFGEYMQLATLGLVEAIDRYQPERGVPFQAFSVYRINGAVLNGLESLSEKRAQLATRRQLLAERRNLAKEGSSESGGDLFQQLAEVAISLALGYILEDESTDFHHDAMVMDDHYSGLELRQLQQRLQAFINTLPRQECLVIKYHYLNQLPFQAIADMMGVTRGRISQIHGKALKRLRDAMHSTKTCDIAW